MTGSAAAPAAAALGPLSALIYGPCAIRPEMLREVAAIYEAHLRGAALDLHAIEARLGRPLVNERQGYRTIDGIAVLPIEGVLAPKANMLTQISGGASTQMVGSELQDALADPGVRGVILQIDSPGGSVLGAPELAGAVRQASKPVVAFSDGQMMSAAYWIGSAADAVFISGATVMLGSIGVVVAHRDRSRANEAEGVAVTEVSAGKYKRLASVHAPLSDEGRASLQDKVDYIYSLFVDAVAAHRGTTAGAVLKHMADGRVFIGQQAIDAGLADGFFALDALIAAMAAEPGRFAKRRQSAAPRAAASPAKPLTRQEKADQARAYATARGVDFVAAWHALNLDEAPETASGTRFMSCIPASWFKVPAAGKGQAAP